ncbi:phenylalanine--tRNA ligase subunit beta [Alicyclobacillus cycloheptanicus]|uniref:Phenylalanine--tRNA ligase beta subunit n=1 Tax=Alicyclobacillus cycloheptanicus TaxID=1457 RepID=A0ABT9XEY3_9BACL|nr:phenylalanine--tRNA ligase subunit beta [Alicyclobacillus cycloheptanicus]MDQ0188762.1 phenylalanyl-tRNA synthetase beta chain [Alicyclobacillus cycloheptanicus]WDM00579.1 phenylalanine--tRNA ligase subunit beta [Alicyclobacillus cycloheptanicus]
MKLSYQWLNEYVDIRDIAPSNLAERLTNAGLAVDAVTPRNQGVQGVVVGEVLTCEPHPNADRLRVCTVNLGAAAPSTIVCGAKNVAAGQRVPVAVPGSVLPGGPIGVAKLRGIESQGMICSAKELGMEVRLLPKEQTEGIYVLPPDAPIGQDVVELLHLDDVVLEIDLTPNRSDCLSLRGLAYEVAALLDRPVHFPEHITSGSAAADGAVRIQLLTDRCPRYEAQVVRGVQSVPSPLWMQARLLAAGVRPINLIVDVTNYVMLEWGQPLHAFDLDEVHDHTIVVRQAQPDETLVTLDGETRQLNADTIVIADVDRAIGIAGVMGGQNSEITAKTAQIIIESAVFDAASVRRAGQRLGLRSEAQQRFEKGVDAAAVRGALVRATALLQTLAGAELVGSVVAAGAEPAAAFTSVPFSPERCNRLLGTAIPATEMKDIFRRLGFGISEGPAADAAGSAAPSGGAVTQWVVQVPTRRPDITLEADLVEEIGRLYGLDAVPATLPVGPTTAGVRDRHQRLQKATRDILTGCGLTEVFTYTFSHPDALKPLRLDQSSPYWQMIPLLRPMSEERIALRTHLLPGLAQVASYNLARGVNGGEIFEIGRVYWPEGLPLTKQPCERMQWAGLWFGVTEPALGERPRRYDFYDAKGVIETWLEGLGLAGRTSFQPAQTSWLHPGRAAVVLVDGEQLGTFGELHPETANALELGTAMYAEFDLDLVLALQVEKLRVKSLPKFPAARRDLAVVVKRDVPAQELITLAIQTAAAADNILENCAVFDVYTGPGVAKGHKSVALALTYRADDRTLTDEEMEALEQKILERWKQVLGATLRTA